MRDPENSIDDVLQELNTIAAERKHREVDRKPVEVGDFCFIGANATILMGTKIGHHSVIGSGSVILENTIVPPYSVVAGVPGKIIKSGKSEVDKIIDGK